MSNWIKALPIVLMATSGASANGLGTPLTASDVAPWDIDVRYDGAGLPSGSGTLEQGDEIYAERCAHCHGDFGEGNGRNPLLIGGEGSLNTTQPARSVGSLWPYAPTLFDYIRRAMPYGDAQSLSADETYAVTAYVLNLNGLWETEDPLDKASLSIIQMPNRGGFSQGDPRPDVLNPRCMSNCETGVVKTEANLFGVGINTESPTSGE